MQTSKFPIKTYPKWEKNVSRKGCARIFSSLPSYIGTMLKMKEKKMGSRCRQAIKLTRIFVIKHLNED